MYIVEAPKEYDGNVKSLEMKFGTSFDKIVVDGKTYNGPVSVCRVCT